MAEHPDDLARAGPLGRCAQLAKRAYYYNAGKLKEAEAPLNAAADIWQRLAQKYPNVPQHDRELARLRQNQGNVFLDTKQYDKAEAAYLASFEIRKRLIAQETTRVEYRVELAGLYKSVGTLYTGMKRPDNAKRAFQHAADIYAKLAEEHPDIPVFKARAEEIERLIK